MPNAFQNKWEPLAIRSARVIVRLWPEETKDWGRAFAAELPEIESFSGSLRWLLGGITLLTRERLRYFLSSLGRPVGVPPNGPLEAARKTSLRFPRTPRLVSALLLVASLAILLHPEAQTSLEAVLFRKQWNPQDWSSFHKLQRKAAETGDPKLLALLSVLHRSNRERARLSNEAIAKDRSLTWLDYRYFYPTDGAQERAQLHEAVRERIQRLQKWDPENAIPRLFAAELLFDEMRWAAPSVPPFYLGRLHELGSLEKAAAANSEWLAAMDSAFRAPRYDTYTSRRFQLIRDIAREYHLNDPDITEYAVAGRAVPDFLNMLAYARILLYRDSQIGGREGGNSSTIADGWKVLHFAQRMQLHGRTGIEDIIAAEIAQQACERLQPLLERSGRRDQARLIGLELERWSVAQERIKSRNRSWSSSFRHGNVVWTGLTIHIAVFGIVFLVAVTLASLGFFAGRMRSAGEACGVLPVLCSFAADIAPPLLLFACVVLFVAYHPYARAYQSYFQAPAPSVDTQSMEDLASAAFVPHALPQTVELALQSENLRYYAWLSATVGLSMLAAFLLYRMWSQQRTI
jgi:hypothetical protein